MDWNFLDTRDYNSIILTFKFLEKHKIKNNIPIILLRPDIKLLEEFDVKTVIENLKDKPVFFYKNK